MDEKALDNFLNHGKKKWIMYIITPTYFILYEKFVCRSRGNYYIKF